VGRLVVAVDRAVAVSPADLAEAWDGDAEARGAGLAAVEAPRPGEFLGDVLALVVIPLAVNLASSAACALVSRLVGRLRGGRPDSGELEVVAAAGGGGKTVVVVRVAGPRR
jgi:hypothetical protein